MDLIRQLDNISNVETITQAKLTALAESAEVSVEVLTESIIAWLGKLEQLARNGQLLQSQDVNMETMPYTLGAISALLDPNAVAGMGLKPETAKTLLKVAFTKNKHSDNVKKKLIQMGQQAAFGQTKKIKQMLDSGDLQNISQAITNINRTAKKQLLLPQNPQQTPQPKNIEDTWFTKQKPQQNQPVPQPQTNQPQNESTNPGNLGLLDIIKTPFDFTKL